MKHDTFLFAPFCASQVQPLHFPFSCLLGKIIVPSVVNAAQDVKRVKNVCVLAVSGEEEKKKQRINGSFAFSYGAPTMCSRVPTLSSLCPLPKRAINFSPSKGFSQNVSAHTSTDGCWKSFGPPRGASTSGVVGQEGIIRGTLVPNKAVSLLFNMSLLIGPQSFVMSPDNDMKLTNVLATSEPWCIHWLSSFVASTTNNGDVNEIC